MPNIMEIQVAQKNLLYDLLSLEKQNKEAGVNVIGLNKLISRTKSGMTKEEIAYVKELIENE